MDFLMIPFGMCPHTIAAIQWGKHGLYFTFFYVSFVHPCRFCRSPLHATVALSSSNMNVCDCVCLHAASER